MATTAPTIYGDTDIPRSDFTDYFFDLATTAYTGALETISLHGDTQDAITTNSEGHDYIDAGDGDDKLFGGVGNDRLYGGMGLDKLDGEVGDDQLHGGADNDKLNGGSGNDRLWGERGADTFIFATSTNKATINDFDLALDILDLRDTATDFQSAADVQAAATTTSNVTTVDLGVGAKLIILNFDKSNFATANFLF